MIDGFKEFQKLNDFVYQSRPKNNTQIGQHAIQSKGPERSYFRANHAIQSKGPEMSYFRDGGPYTDRWLLSRSKFVNDHLLLFEIKTLAPGLSFHSKISCQLVEWIFIRRKLASAPGRQVGSRCGMIRSAHHLLLVKNGQKMDWTDFIPSLHYAILLHLNTNTKRNHQIGLLKSLCEDWDSKT